MNLKELLNGINYTLIKGDLNTTIKEVKYDSRLVQDNDLYIAMKGFRNNGHDYIKDALKNGAKVIILEDLIDISDDVTVIKVLNGRDTLPFIAANFYHHPEKSLTIVGVTGTAGKTTTTHIAREILLKAGIKCGLIGSNGAKYNDIIIPTSNTTPGALEIFKYFRLMVYAGITHVIMETSSQAFKMHRLLGITFDIGLLTNITMDHIGEGEHANMEEYIACKKELLLNSKMVILNNDSNYLDILRKGLNVPIKTFAFHNSADLKIDKISYINEDAFLGTEFSVKGLINDTFRTNLPGEFNLYNALGAIIIANSLGVDSTNYKDALNLVVKGRMETVVCSKDLKVIIDYAHTNDEMHNLIDAIKKYQPKRIISVFGAGGNRAKERRYSYGEIFGEASDLCIITADNPRYENIKDINADIKVGLDKVHANYMEIDDRKEAIEYAILNHQPGDIILLVGKGHEEYIEIKGERYPFSEKEIVEEIWKKLN